MTQLLFEVKPWREPAGLGTICTIDTHTGGEPLRIVTSGLPPILGRTVLEKRRHFMANHDRIRRGLLLEPRGHADMYGAVITAAGDDADLDVFFLNTEGYSPMCGHAILAITKVVLETGLVALADGRRELVMNTPAGRNYARADVVDGVVTRAYFRNVPSFVSLRDERVHVSGLGEVRFDVAFGGAFYAIVDATPMRLELDSGSYGGLVDCGRRIKAAIHAGFAIEHPTEPDLSGLFGVIFTGPARDAANHSRNVNVFEDGEVDRSATGTGVSARAALHVARGDLALGRTISVESILGSTMTVTALERATFGPYEAIIPEVGGTASITGRSVFSFPADDPFRDGFLLR